LISFAGPKETDNRYREYARDRLVEVLFDGVLYDNSVLVQYDNGEKLAKKSVRLPTTLVPASTRYYVQTAADTTTRLGFNFRNGGAAGLTNSEMPPSR
jgi:hypothetical protein